MKLQIEIGIGLLLIWLPTQSNPAEQLLGGGCEPVVTADRITSSGDATKRVQVVWMDLTVSPSHVYRTYSNDLGASWAATAVFSNSSQDAPIDPFGACNVFGTHSPRHMFFGYWNTSGSTVGTLFKRSISGASVDNEVVAQTQGGGVSPDRPWLVCNTASLYLSFASPSSGPLPFVKRTAMPSGTGTVSWTGSAVQVASPFTDTSFVSSFPMATHVDSNGAETVYVVAQQYTEQFPPSTLNKNIVRIWKSTNSGTSWSSDLLGWNVDSADGYVKDRDYEMLPYHLTKDPAPSSSKLYVFYVRNETSPILGAGGTRNVLYCKTSHNNGTTWNGEERVYTIGSSEIPSAGFAAVPANSQSSTLGFFRVARVWSCVDPSGNIYVAWMDNRYGKYGSTDKDYWHVFYSKSTDDGDTWSTPVRVSGTTNATASASIGGGAPANQAWVPPGDFLTCDADSVNLYVAWPDNRADQGGTPGTHAYINVIPQ